MATDTKKKEEPKEIQELCHAVKNYLDTDGRNEIPKTGIAEKQFNEVSRKSGECWDKLQDVNLQSEDKREFFEKFKKEIKNITKPK